MIKLNERIQFSDEPSLLEEMTKLEERIKSEEIIELEEMIKLSGYPIEHSLDTGITFQKFSNNEEIALKVAAEVLANAIIRGFEAFPLAFKISVTWEDYDYEKKFFKFHQKSEPHEDDVYCYAWSVILKDLSRSRKDRKWHYRQCSDCGAWEDLSKPGHKLTKWKRCATCSQKRKRQIERDRRANKPDKRPRGRPAKKERPS